MTTEFLDNQFCTFTILLSWLPKKNTWFWVEIPFAWCKARIPGFPRKSIREGASSLFGRGPERPKNVSCSRATPWLHRCKSGVALEQETILGLSGPRPKRLLAPSLIDFRGNPGIRALHQANGISSFGTIFLFAPNAPPPPSKTQILFLLSSRRL